MSAAASPTVIRTPPPPQIYPLELRLPVPRRDGAASTRCLTAPLSVVVVFMSFILACFEHACQIFLLHAQEHSTSGSRLAILSQESAA